MKVFADLHMHTSYSDGRDSPAAVVREAARRGLGAIAITDHDCVSGIDEAAGTGAGLGVEIVPALEVSAYAGSLEIHILGYFVDHTSLAFLRVLRQFQEERVSRLFRMLEKLDGMGIRIEPERVLAVAGPGSTGRPHLAKVLVEEGHASNIPDAFKRFVGDRAPAYVRRARITPGEAIRLIKGAGGISVLAHPGGLKNDRIIPSLVAAGIEGLEVYYSAHTPEKVGRYCAMADKLGLLITGGSDCHGSMKGEKVSIGDLGISRRLYDELLEYRKKSKRV